MPVTNASPDVNLNPLQQMLYQQNSLKLRSPDGQYLETVGDALRQEKNRDNATQLLHQVSLVQSLTSHIDQHLELPPRAVYGLSDLLHRVEEFCEGHIK